MCKNKLSVSFEDMYQAYLDCRKHKRNKPAAKKFEVNAFYNIQKICLEINNRNYKLRPSQCFIVKDPTLREVFCADFRDRVVQHFVYNELNPVIEKMLIFDAANCRVGKGTDFAIDRVKRFVRHASNNYTTEAHYLKIDLSGFFMNIDRNLIFNLVKDVVWKRYKGKYKEELYYLCKIIIFSDVTKNCKRISPKSDWDSLPNNKTLFNNHNGMPIGNICSQLFANLYLNNLDHLIKSRHRWYSRYVDDMVVVDRSKARLKETLEEVINYLPCINMRINSRKTHISNVWYGIKYLGIIIYPYYTTLSKSRIKRLYASSSKFIDAQSAYNSAASRKGMFRRYKGYRLLRRWYDSFPSNIKRYVKIRSGFDFDLWV